MTKITKPMWKKVIEASLGTQTDIARRLKVTDGAVAQYMERNPDMRELLDKKRMSNVDRAEDVLFEQLDFHDSDNQSSGQRIRQSAAQYIASRLGKNKGWTEKTEIEHSGEMQNNIDLSLIDMCKEYNEEQKSVEEKKK